ncbi:hypothetical protein ACB098_06G048900 [Castanea mollissima]
MGGGGAMRAAAKVAGVGVVSVSHGLRGMPSVPPSEQSVRNASRPVSAIFSAKYASGDAAAPIQMPVPAAWDDWEFADGEETLVMEAEEPMPRLVFGGVPSFEEAKEATTELKDALDKVYLSSPKSNGSGDIFAANHVPGLSLLSSPELETKSCVIFKDTPTAPVPNHVLQAFKLLNGSPEAQTVVASIACDPNVWNAMMDNHVLKDFLQSQQRSDEFNDVQRAKKFEELSVENLSVENETGNSEGGFMNIMENIKLKVQEMVSNVSNYFQNIFGHSASESTSEDDGNTSKTFMDRTLGASFMGLAVLVIMVVVLKRG